MNFRISHSRRTHSGSPGIHSNYHNLVLSHDLPLWIAGSR